MTIATQYAALCERDGKYRASGSSSGDILEHLLKLLPKGAACLSHASDGWRVGHNMARTGNTSTWVSGPPLPTPLAALLDFHARTAPGPQA